MNEHDPTTLVMKRTIAAPVDKVYSAWTEPSIISTWFIGDDAESCDVLEADVRIGGRYDFVMHMPSGDLWCVSRDSSWEKAGVHVGVDHDTGTRVARDC